MNRLEEVREFSNLMAKKEHFRREKLKQRLQSRSGPLFKEQQWLQPKGVDGRGRLETYRVQLEGLPYHCEDSDFYLE